MQHRAAQRVLIPILLFAVAGCAVTDGNGNGRTAPTQVLPAVTAPVEPPAQVAPAPLPQPARIAQPMVPAVDNLLAQSHEAQFAHDTAQAIRYAERAQRIDSRNPVIYQWLAELYRDNGDAAESQQMAQRGLRYASDAQQRTVLEQLAQ